MLQKVEKKSWGKNKEEKNVEFFMLKKSWRKLGNKLN